jgi:chaperonin GroES
MGKRNEVDFTPLRDRILVEPFAAEDVSPGGIILLNANDEPGIDGLVRAVGKGGHTAKGVLIPPTVKVGDHVIYQKFAGTEMTLGDHAYRCIREEEIVGVVG